MAHNTVYLSNEYEIKKAPIGFSWTTLLFGGIPAFFRQDWKWGSIIIIASIFTYGIAGIVFAFYYNKLYLKELFKAGYFVENYGSMDEETLRLYVGLLKLPPKPVSAV